jgi:hypothetical protein
MVSHPAGRHARVDREGVLAVLATAYVLVRRRQSGGRGCWCWQRCVVDDELAQGA